MQLVTRGHIQIPPSSAAGAIRIEIERGAITRQRWTAVVAVRVNRRPQVYGNRPDVPGGVARRDPEINAARSARAIRCNEHFQTVTPDGSACIPIWTVELSDNLGTTERTVFTLRAHINIEVARPIGAEMAIEIDTGGTRFVVLEEGRGVVVQ